MTAGRVAARATGGMALLEPLRGERRALDPAVRGEMERVLEASFGDVVVHTGAASGAAADHLDAAAFTVGRHIVFGPGGFDPSTPRGRMLLAHELAHVVQQRRGGGDPDLGEQVPGAALARHTGTSEGHAHLTAARAALGGSARVSGATGVGIARQSKADEKAAAGTATTPMFQFTDEQGQTKLVTPEEGERLKAEAAKRMRSALSNVESTAKIWQQSHKEHLDMGHAESWGDLWDKPSRIFGVAANIRAGVVPPTLGIWHHPIHVVDEARKALDEGNLREAARLLRLATLHLNSAKADWNEFIEASIGGAEKLQGELEVVRDTSFAIAIGAGAIVAAPIVAGAVTVGGVGGTALTAAGTGLVTMGGGAALRGTADVAGQFVNTGKVDVGKTATEVGGHLKDDFLTGVGAGLAPGLGKAAGLGKQGLSAGQTILRNAVTQSGVAGTTGLLNTALDTGNAVAEGKSWEEVRDKHLYAGLKSTGVGMASGALSAPLGGLGQAVGKGRPLLGQAIEHGGGALLAGGSTLALGGTWDEARRNALTTAVTSFVTAQGQKGTDQAAALKAAPETSTAPVVKPGAEVTEPITAPGAVKPEVAEPVVAPLVKDKAAPHAEEGHTGTGSGSGSGTGAGKTAAEAESSSNATGSKSVPSDASAEAGTASKSGGKGAGQASSATTRLPSLKSIWAKARRDTWKKLAAAELAARSQGLSKEPPAPTVGGKDQTPSTTSGSSGEAHQPAVLDPVSDWDSANPKPWQKFEKPPEGWEPLDPIKELTSAELKKVVESGSMPKRVGAEIEHARIPQRVGKALVDAGLPTTEAAALSKLTDPSNLDPTHRESHAWMDSHAKKGGPKYNALDDRATHPLGGATLDELKAIAEALKKPGVTKETKAFGELAKWLSDEKARRGASADSVELP